MGNVDSFSCREMERHDIIGSWFPIQTIESLKTYNFILISTTESLNHSSSFFSKYNFYVWIPKILLEQPQKFTELIESHKKGVTLSRTHQPVVIIGALIASPPLLQHLSSSPPSTLRKSYITLLKSYITLLKNTTLINS